MIQCISCVRVADSFIFFDVFVRISLTQSSHLVNVKNVTQKQKHKHTQSAALLQRCPT